MVAVVVPAQLRRCSGQGKGPQGWHREALPQERGLPGPLAGGQTVDTLWLMIDEGGKAAQGKPPLAGLEVSAHESTPCFIRRPRIGYYRLHRRRAARGDDQGD